MIQNEINRIKVKDFIKYLETLDQEKLIYVEYDGYATFPPIPDVIDSEGNYKIIAG
jgi:hypothetical protein